MAKELDPYNSKVPTFCHRGGIRDTVVVRKHVSSREVEIPMASNARTGSAQVLLVGLSFRSAPVTMLEQVSIADADMQKMQLALMESDALSEALVLSTCNRFELYTVANAFHDGLDHVVETISRFSAVPAEELEPHLYVHYSNSAAEHMLNVASGLDSMVMGEQQIIGQLRSAYQDANEIGTVGRTLHDLTQRALRTGKRVHSETAIDTAGASMVSFAVDKALGFLRLDGARDLMGKRALVIGAGAMASLASTHLGKLGVEHITVANRTLSRAENLVGHAREAGVNASAVPFSAIPDVLASVDIVVSATGAVECVVTGDAVATAMEPAHRGTDTAASSTEVRPLVLVDLSMPRDIEQTAGMCEGVTLLNIEELTTMAGESAADEDSARFIVAQELEEFLEQQRAQSVIPTVKALRQKAADVMAEELMLLDKHTEGMSAEHRAEVQKTVRRIVDKLLHTPTVQAKRLSAGGQQVSYADALAALFQLPTGTATKESRAQAIRDVSNEVKAISATRNQIGEV